MGFNDFRCARIILSVIETMHRIRKGRMKDNGVTRTATAQFYSLVAQGTPCHRGISRLAELIATQPPGPYLPASLFCQKRGGTDWGLPAFSVDQDSGSGHVY